MNLSRENPHLDFRRPYELTASNEDGDVTSVTPLLRSPGVVCLHYKVQEVMSSSVYFTDLKVPFEDAWPAVRIALET